MLKPFIKIHHYIEINTTFCRQCTIIYRWGPLLTKEYPIKYSLQWFLPLVPMQSQVQCVSSLKPVMKNSTKKRKKKHKSCISKMQHIKMAKLRCNYSGFFTSFYNSPLWSSFQSKIPFSWSKLTSFPFFFFFPF